MANLKEQENWEEGVYQIEENDPVLGGENGITNRPIRQLANRTLWLKKFLELLGKKSVPKDLTANSTSTADDSGHSHKLPVGSTTQKGIWQATSDTGVDSDGLVLTAKVGKKLAQLIATVQLALNNYIPLNKRSSAVNSNDENNVATSKAVKTAYDKGVEGKQAAELAMRLANDANNNANGRANINHSHTIDQITGLENLINGHYRKVGNWEVWKLPGGLMIQTLIWGFQVSEGISVVFPEAFVGSQPVIQATPRDYANQDDLTKPVMYIFEPEKSSLTRMTFRLITEYKDLIMTNFTIIGRWK